VNFKFLIVKTIRFRRLCCASLLTQDVVEQLACFLLPWCSKCSGRSGVFPLTEAGTIVQWLPFHRASLFVVAVMLSSVSNER
jgi:hypothetical protein